MCRVWDVAFRMIGCASVLGGAEQKNPYPFIFSCAGFGWKLLRFRWGFGIVEYELCMCRGAFNAVELDTAI